MFRAMRSLAALALAILFLASAVPAAAASPGPAISTSIWTSAWQWLTGIFQADDNGLTIDPNGGRQRPTAGPGTTDAGGGIDPNGLVVAGVQLAPRREGNPDR